MQSATKEPVEGKAALSLLADANELFVAKGKTVLRFDLEAQRPSEPELLELLLGRSGKLRAPAILHGRRFVVGYNQELLTTALA